MTWLCSLVTRKLSDQLASVPRALYLISTFVWTAVGKLLFSVAQDLNFRTICCIQKSIISNLYFMLVYLGLFLQ